MRKKIPLVLILAAMIAAGILLLLPGLREEGGGGGRRSVTAGDRLLSADLFEKKKKEARKKAFSPDDLTWMGGKAAADRESGTIYIPWSPESGLTWEEVLEGLAPCDKGGVLYFEEDEAAGDLPGAVRSNHGFRALLAAGGQASEFSLVLTGLPALCIGQEDEEEIRGREDHPGELSMVLPLGAREDLKGADRIRCSFHVRGNVSATLYKKPYKVSLKNGQGGKRKTGLLDLRSDDDWILNPLYTDDTRVREMTAYTLWERVSAVSDHPVSSSRIRYVELFLNDAYQGIYGLMEPIDRKQLALSEGDLLYKISRWDWEYPYLDLYDRAEEEQDTVIMNDKGFPCVEIVYPQTWDATATWIPMQTYHRFCFGDGDSPDLSGSGLYPDPENLTDLSLFCALTHAMDDTWKNTFLAARLRPGGGYDLTRVIWDLNYVFGDVFVFKPEQGYTVFDPSTARKYEAGKDSACDFEAFLEKDPSLWGDLCRKWARWREAGIGAEETCRLAEENMETLRAAGALDREMERWPQTVPPDEALEKMENWIRRRFVFLDGYLKEEP